MRKVRFCPYIHADCGIYSLLRTPSINTSITDAVVSFGAIVQNHPGDTGSHFPKNALKQLIPENQWQ